MDDPGGAPQGSWAGAGRPTTRTASPTCTWRCTTRRAPSALPPAPHRPVLRIGVSAVAAGGRAVGGLLRRYAARALVHPRGGVAGFAVTAHSMLKSLHLMMRALLRQSRFQCTLVSWRPAGRGAQPPPPGARRGRGGSRRRTRAACQVVVFDQATKLAHCVAWVHMDQHASVEAAYRAGRAALGSLTGRLSAQRRRLPNGRARPAPRPGPRLGSWPSDGLAAGSAAARPAAGRWRQARSACGPWR